MSRSGIFYMQQIINLVREDIRTLIVEVSRYLRFQFRSETFLVQFLQRKKLYQCILQQRQFLLNTIRDFKIHEPFQTISIYLQYTVNSWFSCLQNVSYRGITCRTYCIFLQTNYKASINRLTERIIIKLQMFFHISVDSSNCRFSLW